MWQSTRIKHVCRKSNFCNWLSLENGTYKNYSFSVFQFGHKRLKIVLELGTTPKKETWNTQIVLKHEKPLISYMTSKQNWANNDFPLMKNTQEGKARPHSQIYGYIHSYISWNNIYLTCGMSEVSIALFTKLPIFWLMILDTSERSQFFRNTFS